MKELGLDASKQLLFDNRAKIVQPHFSKRVSKTNGLL